MSVAQTDRNPYRGWTMVERTGGLYVTRDNLRYLRVPGSNAYGSAWSHAAFRAFHDMVDGIEDGRTQG